MVEQERERIIALLARIGGEMEDASAVAIGAAALEDEAFSLALNSVLNSILTIQSMAGDFMPNY